MVDFAEEIDVETMEVSSFDLIPDGWYIAQIVGEEDKPTKSGRMVVFTWEILDGQFEGRRVWQNHNYLNDSMKAQSIAREQFGLITRASGLLKSKNTLMLHERPMLVHVGIEKGDGSYGDRNTVKNGGYKPIGEAPPAGQVANNNGSTGRSTFNGGSASTEQSPPPRQAAGGGAGSRPWDRGGR